MMIVDGAEAVSYTHLDVYKRQNQNDEVRFINKKRSVPCGIPVSYTHLWVPWCRNSATKSVVNYYGITIVDSIN